jgi:anti-sigma factor ChrR (cupin superfamily)
MLVNADFSRRAAVTPDQFWQMQPGETRSVRIDTRDPARWNSCAGRESCVLFADRSEHVSIERLAAGAGVGSTAVGGAEMLVLEGRLHEGAQPYERGSWVRLPPGESSGFVAGEAGATVYLKTGHLADLAR